MRSLSLRAVAVLGATLAAACSTTPAISNTNNIIRATDVELVCLEINGASVTPRPTTRCALSDTDNGPGANAAFHLHAVVPQFDRGELAVIDLASTSGVALVDNSPSTPGYSFLPVGEFPVAITSDIGESSGYLYVASGRSERVLRVDAAALRSDPRRAGFAASRVEIPVGGLPRDLALVRAGDRHLLVATLPESRSVSITDVTDPAAPGAPRVIALRGGGGTGDAGVAALPHPVALAVDDDAGRVYVTDDAVDQVHVIDVATGAELAALAVGERTRVAAVTGLVRARRYNCDTPAEPDPDHCASTRYLYLTTADQGDVIVWDLARGARVRANLLPRPNARGSRIEPSVAVDRVALLAPATALVAINTSAYDPMARDLPRSTAGEATTCTSYSPASATAFSGVFVGAVLRNGQFAVIDVDDYNVDAWEAQCQVGAGSTATGPYRFVRHAPHAQTQLTLAPSLAGPPQTTAVLRGSTRGQAVEAASAPIFACGPERTREATPTCAEANNFGVALPRRQIGGTDAAPVFGPVDPFTSRNEAWTFSYEGVIPGLDQTGGALATDAGGGLTLEAPGGYFCSRGALAVEGRARDILTIVSDPTPLAVDAEACARDFGAGVAPLNRDFDIGRAFEDRLELVVTVPGGVAAVQRCYPQAIQFQVRAGRQWLALGNRSGFLHSVRVGAGRECEIDDAKQREVEAFARRCLLDRVPPATGIEEQVARICPAGRACTGPVNTMRRAARDDAPVFANPYLCTQIFPALIQRKEMQGTVTVAAPVDRDTQIAFSLVNAWDAFRTDVGALPVAVRHLRGLDRVYVVDTAINGLMEFRFNPFERGRIFN